MKLITGAAALVAALLNASVATANTFTDDFSSGLRQTFWSVTLTTANLYSVSTNAGNVHLAKSVLNSPGGFQAVNVNLLLPALGGNVSGDFSVQVDFSGASIAGSNVNQVQLNTVFGGVTYFGDVFDNTNNTLNAHVFTANQVRGQQNTGNISSGTLRIARASGVVTGYFNGSALFQTSISTPLSNVWLSLQNNGTNNAISTNFDNFSLTAASVPAPVPEPEAWLMFGAGLTAVAAIARRRTRKQDV